MALVPTLGALHSAHRALMRRAREVSDVVAVSIFVNPTQFGPSEDYSRYPRPLEADLEACRAEGVDWVLSPSERDFYPPGEATRVRVSGSLTSTLCARSRPGHFEGVATIVAKLLCATGACRAVFGRKDFQQLQVIKRLVADLLLPVEVVEHPTLRDPDGLATSSRNLFLDPTERERALALPRALGVVSALHEAGERRAPVLVGALREALDGRGLELDYAELARVEDLSPVEGLVESGRVGAFVAARVGSTRLIDNLILGEDPAPLDRRAGA